MIRVFTSAAGNYLGKVAALFSSVRRFHPELSLHLVVADRVPPPADAQLFGAEVILPEQVGATAAWLFKHELVELSTALKGPTLLALLERPDTEAVLYLDPDVVLFSRLDDVLSALSTAPLVVTPHLLEPEVRPEAVADNEVCALQHGAFNLGFLGVRRCEEGLRFAAWWAARLREHCEDRVAAGLFTDQKWMDLAPGFFPGLHILRDPRLNVAPWNISRRRVAGSFDLGFTVDDGRPLGFYHFTGFDSRAHHAMVDKYCSDNRALRMLVDWYERREAALAPRERREWTLGRFADGTPIPPAARYTYRHHAPFEAAYPDPFASGPGTYQQWWESQHPREAAPAVPATPATSAAGDGAPVPSADSPPEPRWRLPVGGTRPAPCNLHVAHSRGGGIDRWLRLFAAHDDDRNLVLSSRGGDDAHGLEHVLWDAADGAELGRWVLGQPIAELADDHEEYARLLRSIVAEHGVAHTYVSSLIGHALEALRLDTRLTVVHHDFFPFCPAVHLHFGSTCASCQPGQLRACLSQNPFSQPFRQQPASVWLRLRSRYLGALSGPAARLVCPSRFVADALRTVDRRFRELPLEVIEHGVERRGPDCFGGAEEGRPLRLLLLGGVDSFNGAASLRRLLPSLCGPFDVALVGGGPQAAELAGLRRLSVVEGYRSDELDRLLGELRPDLALFPSELPESFGFEVAEVEARGIPPCVRNLGALPERIAGGAAGLLFESDADCLDVVRAADEDRGRLRRIAAEIRRRPVRTAAEMVADYRAPAGRLLESRPRRHA